MAEEPMDDLAVQIGRLAMRWVEVETYTIGLFARLINDPTEGRVAAAIMNQFARIHHRIEVINDVIDLTISEPKEAGKLKNLTGEVKRLSKERNRFIHGFWQQSMYVGVILTENLFTKQKRDTERLWVEDVARTVKEIDDLVDKLQKVSPPRFAIDHRE